MKIVNKKSFAWFSMALAAILLTGCGGSSTGESSTASAQSGQQAGPGVPKAVLSWTAPGTRVNGDSIPMGDLDSYIIRYGQSPDELDYEEKVDGAAEHASMEYVIDSLEPGTWYFTIQVRDTQGLLSEPSNVVSKTI